MAFFDKVLSFFKPHKELPPTALPKATADFNTEPFEVNRKQDQPHACLHYTMLKQKFRDIGRMNAIIEALGRDFLTAMPEGAYKSRLGQISFLYRRMHEDLISDDIHKCLGHAREHEYAYPGEWDEWDSANLQEMEHMYLMYCHVDPNLMERKARLSFEGRRRHRDVLKTGDWDQAKKFLTEQINLHRKIADARCQASNEDTKYQMLMQEFMPGMKVKTVEKRFQEHEAFLNDFLPKVLKKQKKEPEPISLKSDEEDYSSSAQMWLNRSLLKVLGFDFERGGLYETGHNPVEGGTVDDTRLVISNVDESDFMDSMRSALHEGGHGLYIQGLPRATWRYQPVAMDMGALVQESQALLIEMIIGRTLEFYEYLSPRLEGLFYGLNAEELQPENLFALKSRVEPGAMRRRADEVTYFYHVKMRFELERDLIEGNLSVDDLPEVWVDKVHKALGVLPNSHAEGCLQDVHWFVGKFGYFPSYALGHMMAAQLYYTMDKEITDMRGKIREGNFAEIKQWLTQNLYSKGRLKHFDDLITDATGGLLRGSALQRHLKERYL